MNNILSKFYEKVIILVNFDNMGLFWQVLVWIQEHIGKVSIIFHHGTALDTQRNPLPPTRTPVRKTCPPPPDLGEGQENLPKETAMDQTTFG